MKDLTKNLTTKAKQEIALYHLGECYLTKLQEYQAAYTRRPPHNDIPTRNMLKALRMLPWLNTDDDWSRLHATEQYLLKTF